ncbi:MAG: hypothetical protein HKN68_09760 [Saprospiraceae bacterium]|nr:hypothetical protein [Saprospiraceae bacterium]
MQLRWILVLLLFLPGFFIQAQQEEEVEDLDRIVIIDLGFNLGNALFPFDRAAPELMAGGELGFYFQLEADQPYAVGIDFTYNYVGGHSVEFPEIIDGVTFDLRERANTHMISLLPSVRLYPNWQLGKLKPYFQASLGAKIFFTDTHLYDISGGGAEVSEYDIQDSSVSWSYGGTIGVNIDLGSFVFLNARIGITPGVSAPVYGKLPEDEIPNSDFAIDAFRRINTTTPMMRYGIGVSFFL